MQVPLLDLKKQYQGLKDEILPVLHQIMESQMFIMGHEVEGLEREVADYSGCKYGIGISSGTDALLIALMALDLQAGDEVITSPYTFFATAGCIHRVGAVPVFVDIDPATFNLIPELVEQAITPRTKAIMPVHLFGQAADMEPLMGIARRNGLRVIEDAAQAIGSEYDGQRAGSMGDMGCFSFFPSKNLGGFGDGGMVTTNDPALAEKVALLRNHGMKPKYFHKLVGGNFRLDAMQAAVLRIKLRHLDTWTEGRRRNAQLYRELFSKAGLVASCEPECFDQGCSAFPSECQMKDGAVILPEEVPARRHIYNQFVIRVNRRDELMAFLKEKTIGTEVYYPVPLHLQECFAYLGHKPGSFPASECAAAHSLALPVFPELTPGQIGWVVDSIRAFYS